METDRRRLLIQACRQRQEQIKAKLKLLRQKMSGKTSPRGQQLERELLLRYHQEGQRIQRLLAESQESEATRPARPAPVEESPSAHPNLQDELSQSRQQTAELRAELHRLQQKLEQAEAQVVRLGQEHGALTHLAAHRAQQVERLQQEVDDLVQEVAQSHQHSQESFLEVQETRQQLEQIQAQHQAELAALQEKSQAEIDRLTSELIKVRVELAQVTRLKGPLPGSESPVLDGTGATESEGGEGSIAQESPKVEASLPQAEGVEGSLAQAESPPEEVSPDPDCPQATLSSPQSFEPETVEFLAVDDLEAEGDLSEFTSIEADSPPDWLLSDQLPD